MAPNTGMGMQVQNDLALDIYPNPNKGRFTVELSHPGRVSANIMIMNNIGEAVYSRKIEITGHVSKTIDLHTLSKGVYYLRVQTDKELITGKVVIQ